MQQQSVLLFRLLFLTWAKSGGDYDALIIRAELISLFFFVCCLFPADKRRLRLIMSSLFSNKKRKPLATPDELLDNHHHHNGREPETPTPRYNAPLPPIPSSNGRQHQAAVVKQPKLVFHCQQAHGSPTGLISGFTNVKELYEKIADCYDLHSTDVRKVLSGLHFIDKVS